MAASPCPNVTSSDTNSSAPVPIIGLYIAAATITCFVLILVDVIRAFRSRKPWIPCKFFKLDAVSLSLLAVVTKLPVDLTTAMPSSLDQLSKITGTSLICICMCYFVPSVGASSSSESFSNMIALTVFVITVVVNICIQISTHVISSFIPQHVLVMFFMLAALSLLWQSTVGINFVKILEEGMKRAFFIKMKTGGGSLLLRLQFFFFDAYITNPQIQVVKRILGPAGVIHVVSFCCSIVELQVIFRSLIQGVGHGFFSATSDYKWSMGIIVVSQIFLILLGTLANGVRWARMLSTLVPPLSGGKVYSFSDSFPARLLSWQRVVDIVMNCIFYLFYFPHLLAFRCVRCCCGELFFDDEGLRIIYLMGLCGLEWNKWTWKNCMESMNRWMRVKKGSSPTSLIELLSNTLPSQQSLQDLKNQFKPIKFEISGLDLVLIEKLISISIPSTISGFLIQKAMDEVFDIVLFVDSKVGSECNYRARATREAESFRIRKMEPPNYQNQPPTGLDHLQDTIRFFGSQCKDDNNIVLHLIGGRQYSSIEELYKYVEQLFVDLLHIFLIQLPEAVLKEVAQSSLEEYEEKAGRMLQLLKKLEPLESKVQWSFPDNITSFVTGTSDTSPSFGTPIGVSDVATTKDNDTIEVVQSHEIIEVE